MRILIFTLTIFLIFVQIGTVFAASSSDNDKDMEMSFSAYELKRWKGLSEKLSARYEENIRDIRSGKARLENKIYELRAYYPYTKYYDPFSKKLTDEMTRYAYIVDTSKDRAEVNRALNSFRELVYKHLAHLGVVTYAVKLSSLDPQLGDMTFYKRVRDLIRSSWDDKGNAGIDPDNAYKVITFDEEAYILGKYGATVKKSEMFEVSKQFFDVRDIVTEDGEYIQIFFDVTKPIRHVNLNRALIRKEAEAYIPLQ